MEKNKRIQFMMAVSEEGAIAINGDFVFLRKVIQRANALMFELSTRQT